MIEFSAYRDLYPYAALDRHDGVLTVRLHTNQSAWQFGQMAQDTMTRLFRDIADDRATRVVIIEGTGQVFCTSYIMSELGETVAKFDTDWSDRWMKNGRYMLAAMLEVEAPLIWCLNGPVTVHPEFWFGACDVILAEPSAYVRDETHVAGGNMIAGDTIPVWESLLGLGRARYFHLMAQTLDATELHRLGIAHEIVPRAQQRARAEAIAAQLMKLAPLTLKYSRFSMNSRLRREAFLDTHPSYGMLGVAALEMFGPRRETSR